VTERAEPDLDKADCYSDRERRVMLGYQGYKQRLLAPLLRLLDRLLVTPDGITWFSVALGAAFVPCYLFVPGPWGLFVAHLLLLAHLIVDGIDGPLARHQGRASSAGSLTDTFGDQLVIVATALAYATAEGFGRAGLHPVTAGCYAVLYDAAVMLAMIRNAMGIPYRFLLRPRNFFYGLMWFDAYGWWGAWSPGIVEGTVWCFNVLLAAAVLFGFVAVRREVARREMAQREAVRHESQRPESERAIDREST